MNKNLIAVVQNIYPHYRKGLFDFSGKQADLFVQTKSTLYLLDSEEDIYTYRDIANYEKILVPMELTNLLTWYLLLRNGSKTFLIGQGTNPAKRYFRYLYGLQIYLSKASVIYCKDDYNYWAKYINGKKLYLLNNTLDIDLVDEEITKCELRKSYGIPEKSLVFISSYRFENKYRKDNEYYSLVERLQNRSDVYFIIIGGGSRKPPFSRLKNVLDIGECYDEQVKARLFKCADYYIQLGWTGLSVVEAMKRGLKVVTLSRSVKTKQCVEYCYLESGKNAEIFDSIQALEESINTLKRESYYNRNSVADTVAPFTIETARSSIKRMLELE